MNTARDIIESLQESQHFVPIDQHIAILREVIADRQEKDGTHGNSGHDRLLKWALDFRNRRRVSELQDPVTLYEIAQVWDILTRVNSNEFLAHDDPNVHPANVLLATAATGRLNAEAIRGDDGSRGILFESDLAVWSSALAELISRLYIIPAEDAIYISHPSIPGFFNGKDQTLLRLLQCFANTAVHGNALVCAQVIGAAPFGEHKFIREQIDRGFLAFILGHEYSHLVFDHHTSGRVVMARHLTDAAVVFPDSPYAPLQPRALEDEELVKLIKAHGREYEADLQGEGYCINYLKAQPDHPTRILNINDGEETTISDGPPQFTSFLFSTLGISLFLWSIEYLEKTVRTLACGVDGSDHALFTTDCGTRDLVAFEEHPCPLSRIYMLKMHSKIFNNASEMVELLFSRFWQAAYPKLQELHEQGYRPHQKWIHGHVHILRELMRAHNY